MKTEDCAPEIERETLRITDNGEKRCPNLRNIDKIIFYCGSDFPDCASIDEKGITKECAERRVEPEHFEIYCTGIYKGCAYFKALEHPVKCRVD